MNAIFAKLLKESGDAEWSLEYTFNKNEVKSIFPSEVVEKLPKYLSDNDIELEPTDQKYHVTIDYYPSTPATSSLLDKAVALANKRYKDVYFKILGFRSSNKNLILNIEASPRLESFKTTLVKELNLRPIREMTPHITLFKFDKIISEVEKRNLNDFLKSMPTPKDTLKPEYITKVYGWTTLLKQKLATELEAVIACLEQFFQNYLK